MKVCTIWGFEEPENGLELLKTFKLADEFELYSKEIQMFISTHSPAFYMKKDNATSKIFFVSKKSNGDETSVSSVSNSHFIAENMGLMPLVAPFIQEQSRRLLDAEKIFSQNFLTDVPTILVEGETDIDYLKIAFEAHSEILHNKVCNNELRIVCKNNGAGTTEVLNWTLAWIYSGFKSKLFVLLDKDLAGIKAQNDILNSEAYRHKQSSVAIKLQHIEPSDEIISLLQAHISFEYEIEHLLSPEFWKKIKSSSYQQLRTTDELNRFFAGLVPRDKSLDSVIEDLVPDPSIKETILLFAAKELKKKRIVQLLKEERDIKETTRGMLRTIKKIEEYFA